MPTGSESPPSSGDSHDAESQTDQESPADHESPTAGTAPTDSQPSLWRNRDFRRFFAGQFVTNAGDSLYTVAVLWLVFGLSGSTVLTGIANSMLLLPWLLQILAGPVVDRLPLKPVLVGSQVVQGVVVLVLPLAAATGNLTVGVILAVVPLLVLSTLVMAPMQTTLLPRIVPETRLSKANSALATVTLGLDMVFDALGGAFIAVFGATTLFLFDSVTFALAALLFAGVGIGRDDSDDGQPSEVEDDTDESVLGAYLDDLRAGIDTLRGSVFVELILMTAVANFAVGVTLAILPSFGDGLGGPAVYGLLLGALGIGRLAGSVVAPYLEDVQYGRLLLVGHSLGAVCWLAAVYAPTPALTVVLFGLSWVPAGASGVLTATLNQTVFPKELLGRVSSVKGTASGATLPLGSLVGGVVAAVLGTQTTMGLAAFGFGFTGLYTLLRPRIRGLPSVADADPAAFDVTTAGDGDGG
ncbi:MFS transporter [Haloarchaeobius iranensis]|uniref:Transmembrane secretion effector n=1 Tax=Haloarchaeobius iranensis TaxID=996166 RepID=A0A1H0A8J6_9EURY|nr:MFS transporter [Haloarchaeobius iranensis]SDN29958.1 Transmembrane secretion effector [Haloarchaeobius iranensis]